MPVKSLIVNTNGEELIDITADIIKASANIITSPSGILHLFVMHTSCALTISESYDPAAKRDLEKFLKHLAPRDLQFIEHDDEGPDDSPSHMKSLLLNQSLCFPIENSKIMLGQWQGIYLAEFRDSCKKRKIILKYISDL